MFSEHEVIVSITICESGFMWSAVAISITKDYVLIYLHIQPITNLLPQVK